MDVNKTYRMRMAKQEDRAAGHDEDAQRDREAKDAAQVASLRAELGSEEKWAQVRELTEATILISQVIGRLQYLKAFPEQVAEVTGAALTDLQDARAFVSNVERGLVR